MKKVLLFMSFIMCSMLIYKAETHSPNTAQNTDSRTFEHHILLDLTKSSDKVIYDNLIYSSYHCSKLNPKQVKCSQFKNSEPVTSKPNAVEVYKYESKTGQALKVYQLASGEAHIEFEIKSSPTLYRYSFTSIEQASNFTSEHKDLFKTDFVEWDISYLDYIL